MLAARACPRGDHCPWLDAAHAQQVAQARVRASIELVQKVLKLVLEPFGLRCRRRGLIDEARLLAQHHGSCQARRVGLVLLPHSRLARGGGASHDGEVMAAERPSPRPTVWGWSGGVRGTYLGWAAEQRLPQLLVV